MTSGGPDLFVVCKSCRSEVSPYITECPYCGARLRKRAPKLDREGRVQEVPPRAVRRRRRPAAPSLGRLRRNEIPGVRGDTRPVVTAAWVLGSLVLLVLWRAGLFDVVDVALLGSLDEPWRVVTAPFAYASTGYAFVALTAIALFGWLLERRHGPWAPLVIGLAGGAAGMALSGLAGGELISLGGNGAALALLAAWALPDVLRRRRGEDWEGDLLGTAVIAVVLLLLPAVVEEADWVAGTTGLLVGVVLGGLLDRIRPTA